MRAQELADAAESARAEADAANRLKDEFLAVVSHELRTPLERGPRVGAAARRRAARSRADDGRDPHHRAQRQDAGAHDRRSPGRVADHGRQHPHRTAAGRPRRGDSGRHGRGPARRPGEDRASDVHLSRRARSRRRRLAPAAADRREPPVERIKFTPAGGQVEVTLTSAGSHAEIQVVDTGQGIDAAFLPHIFERFSQADPSTTRRQGGLGLGLAIVRALVERHGGTVQADSPGPGLGATFTVRLPVLAFRDAGASPAACDRRGGRQRPSPPARPASASSWSRTTPTDGRSSRLILEVAGAKVTAAASVREALAVLDTARPDVIVSDIGMPDEDGYALIRQVRAREADGRAPPPSRSRDTSAPKTGRACWRPGSRRTFESRWSRRDRGGGGRAGERSNYSPCPRPHQLAETLLRMAHWRSSGQ